MKTCSKCQAQNDDQQNFCNRCGAKLAAAAPAAALVPPPPPAGAGTSPPSPQQPQPAQVPQQPAPAVPPTPTAQSAPPPPPQSGPAAPPPPQPPVQGKSKWWIWLIVVIAIIAVIVVIAVLVANSARNAIVSEFEQAAEDMVVSVTPTATTTPRSTTTPIPTPTTTTTPTPTATAIVPSVTADDVVYDFLNATVGTLPAASLNYNLTLSYLSDDMKALYPDSSYIPTMLCMQNGPDDVIVGAPVESDLTYVTVQGSYGGVYDDMWEFSLEPINGEWRIVDIGCLQY